MNKGDVIGWAAILGGIALLGYLGYRGIRSLFPGGNGNGDTDIFGNPTAASEAERREAALIAGSEHSTQLAEAIAAQELAGSYPPDLIIAEKEYLKELNEFYEVQNAPKRDWLGKLTPEYHASYNKELNEANAAYARFKSLVNYYWGATQT
jgi:hypothetical protein